MIPLHQPEGCEPCYYLSFIQGQGKVVLPPPLLWWTRKLKLEKGEKRAHLCFRFACFVEHLQSVSSIVREDTH